MLHPGKRPSAAIGAIAVCAAIVAAAVPTALATGNAGSSAAKPLAEISGPNKYDRAVPKVPKARFSAKIESCTESATYATRGVGVYAAMRPYRGTKKMRMRVRLLRKYPGQARYSKVEGLGLDEWMSLSPRAAVSIRHVAITRVETRATYRAKVDFRWTGRRGRKIAAKSRSASGRCMLKTPSPDIQATALKIVGGVPRVTNYEATVTNIGGSEALPVDWEVHVDGKVVASDTLVSMLTGATVTLPVNAASCNQSAQLVVDPKNVVRESDESNNSTQLTCGSTGP